MTDAPEPGEPTPLARRVAEGVHDVCNWLNVALTYAEVLKATLPADSPAHQAADKIANACRQAATASHQLAAEVRVED